MTTVSVRLSVCDALHCGYRKRYILHQKYEQVNRKCYPRRRFYNLRPSPYSPHTPVPKISKFFYNGRYTVRRTAKVYEQVKSMIGYLSNSWASCFYSASAELAMQSAVLAIVNPSVRLSLRLSHAGTVPMHDRSLSCFGNAETTQATIMGSSLEDSPMTSFLVVNFTANSKGNIGSERAE